MNQELFWQVEAVNVFACGANSGATRISTTIEAPVLTPAVSFTNHTGPHYSHYNDHTQFFPHPEVPPKCPQKQFFECHQVSVAKNSPQWTPPGKVSVQEISKCPLQISGETGRDCESDDSDVEVIFDTRMSHSRTVSNNSGRETFPGKAVNLFSRESSQIMDSGANSHISSHLENSHTLNLTAGSSPVNPRTNSHILPHPEISRNNLNPRTNTHHLNQGMNSHHLNPQMNSYHLNPGNPFSQQNQPLPAVHNSSVENLFWAAPEKFVNTALDNVTVSDNSIPSHCKQQDLFEDSDQSPDICSAILDQELIWAKHFPEKCASASNCENSEIMSETTEEKESEELVYECALCSHQSSSVEKATEHARMHESPIFRCRQCSFTGSNSAEILQHLRCHRKLRHPTQMTIECPKCAYRAFSKDDFMTHSWNAHYRNSLAKPRTKSACGTGKECELPEKHRASVIHFGANHAKSSLRRHLKNISSFSFKDAPQNFKEQPVTTTQPLHQKEIYSKFPVKETHKFIDRKSHLPGKALVKKISRRRTAVITILECESCPYSTTRLSLFEQHRWRHSAYKPYQCNLCDFSTIYPHSLTVHIRRHTGEKPYKCSVCSKAFAYPSSFSFHKRRVHSYKKVGRKKTKKILPQTPVTDNLKFKPLIFEGL